MSRAELAAAGVPEPHCLWAGGAAYAPHGLLPTLPLPPVILTQVPTHTTEAPSHVRKLENHVRCTLCTGLGRESVSDMRSLFMVVGFREGCL